MPKQTTFFLKNYLKIFIINIEETAEHGSAVNFFIEKISVPVFAALFRSHFNKLKNNFILQKFT